MDFTVWSLIITTIATLSASIIGGIIGGIMALSASKQAARDAFLYSLQLQRQVQDEMLRGLLLALQTEITTLFSIYKNEFGEVIEALNEGDEFNYFYPIEQNYFTLYEANAQHIGLLPDDELRNLIVKTYLKGRAILDTHRFNNEMLAETDKLHVLNAQNPTSQLAEQIELAHKGSLEYGINIKINYQEMTELIESLDARIALVLPKLSNSKNV